MRTGLAVFAATLDSENRSGNAITFPISWRPAAALGPGCRSSSSIAAARLADTVLLDAMAEAGYIFDLVALYYAPLGDGPGDTAENILLLDGGWLE